MLAIPAATIYLDNAATTPVDPAVVQAMLPFLTEQFANPSSIHAAGVHARRAVERARQQILDAIGSPTGSLVFTSGGTEANNLAIKGLAKARSGELIVVSAVDHPSAREAAREAADSLGVPLAQAPIVRQPGAGYGQLDLARLEATLHPKTAMVALIHGQNETGVLQPVLEAARIIRRVAPRAFVHVDCVQSFGKVPLAALVNEVDSVSLSAHKIHGPKGTGALVLSTRTLPQAQIVGGGQESGLRSGTENVAGIVGFGEAAALAAADTTRSARLHRMAELIHASLAEIPDAFVLGGPDVDRLPTIVCAVIEGLRGETLQHHLESLGFLIGTGSACHAARDKISATYRALGLDDDRARSVIRISTSRCNREVEVEHFARELPNAVRAVRELVR